MSAQYRYPLRVRVRCERRGVGRCHARQLLHCQEADLYHRCAEAYRKLAARGG